MIMIIVIIIIIMIVISKRVVLSVTEDNPSFVFPKHKEEKVEKWSLSAGSFLKLLLKLRC